MACEIIFKNGRQIGVNAPDGRPSLVFNQILNIPHIQNFQEALQGYTNLLADNNNQEFSISFQSQGEDFQTLKEALKNSKPNSEIQVVGNGKSFMTIDATINPQTRSGLLNSLIKEDILTGNSFLDVDGSKVLEVTGNNEQEKAVYADVARTVSKRYKGAFSALVGQDYNITFRERQEVPKEKSFTQLTKEFDEPTAVFIKTLEEFTLETNANSSALEELQIIPENELQQKLLQFLNKLGVKTTSIEKWSEKYAQKNGYEPSAKALADLSNNIVAFKDGIIAQAELTEEVSHFIIATLDQEQIANQKRNVHRTKEWSEFAEQYFEIYGETLEGEALEDAVREEILGKVLANSLLDNFARENDATLEGGIVATLRNFFQDFFNRVYDFFQPSYQTQIETFTEQVYRDLMNDSLDVDVRNKENKSYTLYNATGRTALAQTIQKSYETLLNQQYALRNSSANKNSLAKLKETITLTDEASLKNSTLQLVAVANSQANSLLKSLETADKNSRHFTSEENGVFQSTVSRLAPMLRQIRESINDKTIAKQIDDVLQKISTVEGRVPATNTKARDLIVERVIRKNNMTPEQANKYRSQIEQILTTAQADTSWLHAHLGGLINAKNGLLNLAGEVIERTEYQARTTNQNQTKPFLNRLEELKIPENQISKIFKNLIYNGSIIHEKDPQKVLEVDNIEKAKILSIVLGQPLTKETVQEKIDSMWNRYNSLQRELTSNKELSQEQVGNKTADRDLISSQLAKLEREFRKVLSQRRESRIDPNYLEKLNNFTITSNGVTIGRENIPQHVIDLDRMYRNEIAEIRGNGDLTLSDKAEIKASTRRKLNEANPRYVDGKLKKGVLETYDRSLGKHIYTLDVTQDLGDVDLIEAEKVVGLQNLMLLSSEFRKTDSSSQDIPQKFLDEIDSLQTEQEKLDFLNDNASISFTQEFWDAFDPNNALVARLLEENSPEARDLAESIREQQSVISTIIRGNKNLNNPSEVDTYDMSNEMMLTIKQAQGILDARRAEAYKILEEQETTESSAVSVINESYRKDLQSNEISENSAQEIDFILQHVTDTSGDSIRNVRANLRKLQKGESVIMTELMKRLTEGRTDYDNILSEYARTKLLPYYKRTEPEGFTEAYEDLKNRVSRNENGAVRDYMDSKLVVIRPSWSFYDSMANANPKWIENEKAGREQYTEEYLKSVRNDEYYNRYGIDEQGNATQNIQEFEARKVLLEYNDQSLENYGIKGTHDRYQLPQILRSAVRRLTDGSNKLKSLKEIASDMTGVREDEADLGQDVSGNLAKKGDSILSVPTYGVRKLKDQSDVTDELLLSYALFNQQSALYKARRENISDMLVLEDFILSTDYAGKKAEATNTVKMFNSFLKSNFYGVKETFSHEVTVLGKKVDLGKLARTFNSWVRFSNLAGITVPLTSALQGKTQELLERFVGEAIDKTAYNEAQKEFARKGSQQAGEIMKYNGKAELNVYGERFGLYNLTERFENSYIGRAGRALLKSSSGLHSIGNFPVTTTAMLSVMYDYRIYGNEVLTYRQFKELNNGKDDRELWKKQPLFKDLIPVKGGVIVPNYKSIAEQLNISEQEAVEKTEFILEAINGRVASAVQRIDSQIPASQKSVAARDARSAFFLLHASWWLVAGQNKFKSRSYNTSEGVWTEGSWNTVFNMTNSLAQNVLKPKELKRVWGEYMADELSVRNLRRTILELAVANALAVAVILLANMSDDEPEDPGFLLSWSEYMLLRVAVEQTSSTVSLPMQLDSMLSNPLISAEKFKDLGNILDLTDSNIIDRGTYAGSTVRYKWMSKNLPFIRDYNRFRDFNSAKDTYYFFNKSTLESWTFATVLADNESED